MIRCCYPASPKRVDFVYNCKKFTKPNFSKIRMGKGITCPVNNFFMKKRKLLNLGMQIIGELFVILHAQIEVTFITPFFGTDF